MAIPLLFPSKVIAQGGAVQEVAADPGGKAKEFAPHAVAQCHDVLPASTGAGCHSWSRATNHIARIRTVSASGAGRSLDVTRGSADDLVMGRGCGKRARPVAHAGPVPSGA